METRFVVIEGIDGAGTTTQAERLVRELAGHGIDAHGTREPSDGPIGTLLRALLTQRTPVRASSPEQGAAQLALLFAADRLDHLGGVIEPERTRGRWVVSDRYDYSSVAYQSVSSAGAASVTWLRSLNRHAQRPDLTLVLDVQPDVARARRLARDDTRELFDDDELQRRLAAFYADIDRHFPDDRIVHVDANRSADEVFVDVLAAVLSIRA
jgi:dTMP kinase